MDLKTTRVNGFYTIDGVKMPSVTTILNKMADHTGLDIWKKRQQNLEKYLKEAALTGSLMHLRILQRYSDAQIELPGEMPIMEWPPGLEEELDKRDSAWECLDLKIENAVVEKTLTIPDPIGGSAGTLDMQATIEGFNAVLDLKSSKKIYESQQIQVAAYALGLERTEGYEVERGYIVALRGGDYEMGELERSELVEYGEKYIEMVKDFYAKYMTTDSPL
jgi:CRISPR/Cas system-associated exonuclease Cas4 (RecB family)